MEFTYRILATIFCVTKLALSINKQSVEFTALDCRHPKGIVRSPISSLCDHKTEPEDSQPQSIHVLQYDQSRVIQAVTCTIVKTKMLAYCGSFSHSKIYEPLDILVAGRISHDTCVQVYKTSLYTQEDGHAVTVAIDRPHTYKYLGHGSLKTSNANVECVGEQFQIHGKLRSNMLELVTATFTMHSISIEVDPDNGVKDLDTGYSLPNHCMTDGYCFQYGKQYVMLAPRSVCPLYKIRSLPMVETKYTRADQKGHTAFVSTEHQLILERRGEFVIPKPCHSFPKVYNTNYDKVKIIIGKLAPGVVSEVNSYSTDLSLQTRILHDYANFHAERLINSRLDETLHDLCAVNHFGVTTSKLDPTHDSYLVQRTGEIFTRFVCTNVTVLARAGSNKDGNCLEDALPVYLGREKLALTANTRMLLDLHDAPTTACSSQFLPVFIGKHGHMVVANPMVRLVNLSLTNMNLPMFRDHGRMIHETADHFSLYTKHELKEFNMLLHFGRTKQAVLTELTEKYCQGQTCGSLAFGADRQTFDLDRLRSQIEARFDWTHQLKEAIQYCGKVGGCLFVVYFSTKILMKLVNAIHLYFNRDCSLDFAMRTSLYRDRAIDNLIIAHLRIQKKKEKDKRAADESKETLTSTL